MSGLTFRAHVGNARALSAQRQAPPTRLAIGRQQPIIEDRVRIRFSRFGRKKRPFYRIVAVDSRKPRETRPLEWLGWYDPFRKETNLNAPAIKKWLDVGAQPSDVVRKLLKRAMVIEE